MTFSKRVQQNYRVSGVKNWIVIVIAGWFLLAFIVTPISIFLDTGGFSEMFESVGDFFGTLFFFALFAGLSAICFLVIRHCFRKIRSDSLEKFKKTLEPFGDPEALMAWADSQNDRCLAGVDLRFDDTYMAVADGRDIRIRRMDQVRYCWDYGVNFSANERRVWVCFADGGAMTFKVRNNDRTGAVLEEFFAKTAFGKWIREGELNHSHDPFQYQFLSYSTAVECDGKTLLLRENRRERQIPMEELKSCYMYVIPDSESSDDYYLVLYLADGTEEKIQVGDGREGFGLYLKLLNCAPQLEYRFAIAK